jgi:hypothetical protein
MVSKVRLHYIHLSTEAHDKQSTLLFISRDFIAKDLVSYIDIAHLDFLYFLVSCNAVFSLVSV